MACQYQGGYEVSPFRSIKTGLVAFLFFLLAAFFPLNQVFSAEPEQPLKNRIDEIFKTEINLLLSAPRLQVDALWAVQEMLKIQPDAEISASLDSWKIYVRENDPFRLLIDKSAPRIVLPEKPGVGSRKFFNFVLAPLGSPPDRARSFISQFLASRETGYFLTHQFLVLEWARQTGLDLPQELLAKRTELLARILDEQLKESRFSDLYAERAAILLHFSTPSHRDAEKWVRNILESRKPAGGWGEYRTVVTYDGENYTVNHTADHTRVLALLALRAYYRKYLPSIKAGRFRLEQVNNACYC